MNLSIVERKKGSRASIRKIQEEKATLERVTGNDRGITQQNRMQFGLMAQTRTVLLKRIVIYASLP